jgi:hypothetical protein
MIVATKREAYRLAAEGKFGNVLQRYFHLQDWYPDAGKYPLWGVQTTTVPGGPCRLNCPTAEVAATFAEFRGFGPVISGMVSACVPTLWCGDVWDSPTGLQLSGLLAPPLGFNWRREMLTPRHWEGSAARAVLRLLNDNGRSDLEELTGEYPGQVIEVSIFERPVGVLPNRNYVVWEIRNY